MRRFAALAGATLLGVALGAPAVLAAEPELPHSGRVLMAFGGDIDVPAGEQADVVLVGQGDALVAGTVNAVVVLDGALVLRDATVESVVIVGGSVALEGSTVVRGDIRSIDSTVDQGESAVIGGTIRGVDAELLMMGAFLVPALFLLALGFALATILAGLVLVALASRQVRAAERLIVREPGQVFVVGLLSAIFLPIAAIIAIVTVVGAPLGFSLLLAVLPALAFVGYLVAGIFVGEQLLGNRAQDDPSARPYKAAVVGIVVLQAVGLIPGLGALATGVASLFGLGAVLILAWRTMRGTGSAAPVAPSGSPIAIGA